MACCSYSCLLSGKAIWFSSTSENRFFRTTTTKKKKKQQQICLPRLSLTVKAKATTTSSLDPTTTTLNAVDNTGKDDGSISLDMLDDWIHNSVTEIVRNIEEAPFLMHVYSNKGTTTPIMEREKAVSDSWVSVTRRWDRGSPIPDGVILVEQIDGYVQQEHTKAWGLVVQGRGVDRPACYILKTCRVSSSCGFCTHFCLVRAKCFGDTPQIQLDNSWLIPN